MTEIELGFLAKTVQIPHFIEIFVSGESLAGEDGCRFVSIVWFRLFNETSRSVRRLRNEFTLP